MEGAPKQENVENLQDWRELKDSASKEAKKLIAGIKGFYVMAEEAQVVALQGKIDELSSDNENRFLVPEIAREQAKIQEHIRHERELARIAA